MASITINSVPNQGTSSTAITGEEKLIGVTSSGKPVTIGVNQILNQVDDRIDDVIEDQIDEKVDQQFNEMIDEKVDAAVDERLDEVLDNVGNFNWNNV